MPAPLVEAEERELPETCTAGPRGARAPTGPEARASGRPACRRDAPSTAPGRNATRSRASSRRPGSPPGGASRGRPSARSRPPRRARNGRRRRRIRRSPRAGRSRCPWSWTSSGRRARTRPCRWTVWNGALPVKCRPHHDHAGHPEEEDVEAGHQHVGRIERLQVRGLVGPAEDREGPELGENHVSSTSGSCVSFARAARRAGGRVLLGHGHLPVVAVKRGDAVAPPELARDAPVVDVVHPLEYRSCDQISGTNGSRRPRRPRMACSASGWILHEPLRREVRLDDGAGSAGSGRARGGSPPLRPGGPRRRGRSTTRLARLETVKAGVRPAGSAFIFAFVDDVICGSLWRISRLEVVGVVRGRDLHGARTELGIHQDRP